jgi:DNA-binding NarL/FixJ family response regulator
MRVEPLSVALVNDYPVVVAGLQQMLAPFSDRIQVVEMASQLPVESAVDIVLYDAFTRERVIGPVEEVLRGADGRAVVYTWRFEPELVREALDKGIAGWLSKSLSAEELVDCLERVHQGEVVVSEDPGPDAPVRLEAYPGQEHGLSPRESEVLALICQGLSNQQIADRAYVSVNSVKTYIRSAYRKIGVERRTQALLWATAHGFLPSTSRRFVQDR